MADQQRDDVSVVGQGARIEGTLKSTGSLRIHGHLTGEIAVDGDVSVASGSDVRADISARSISLAGRIKGNLDRAGRGGTALPEPGRGRRPRAERDRARQGRRRRGRRARHQARERSSRARRRDLSDARDRGGRVLRRPFEHGRRGRRQAVDLSGRRRSARWSPRRPRRSRTSRRAVERSTIPCPRTRKAWAARVRRADPSSLRRGPSPRRRRPLA